MKKLIVLCLFAFSTAFAAVKDEVSFANLEDVVTQHVHLNLLVDFEKKRLIGHADLSLKWLKSSAKKVVLDTRDLNVERILYWNGSEWIEAVFSLGDYTNALGAPLTITLPTQTEKLRIKYQTSPTASGLQWLSPEQTAGKKHPFMYSQSQAIHARSWIPIQDTPSMRVTYSASISTPKNLYAVMSADNSKNTQKNGQYEFDMPQAISPYLIAIGVGDLQYQSMSKQTGIYAEPSVLQSALAEFNDTQKMIDANEKLYGAYRWGQYDLLILPPAFPFGGMENPRLSFITPTVIAGDKSLVNLIAHELAHSWSGNLVTNSTWRDLWLNEGFTSYVENRVMEELYGESRAVMEQWLGVNDLKDNMKKLPVDDTRLHLPLNGRDPDDAFSNVPYVKGQLFLMFLEAKFGREKFDGFLKQYFNDHAFQSISTVEFITYLEKHLTHKYPNVVSDAKVKEWIFDAGLPKDAPNPVSDVFERVDAQKHQWMSKEKTLAELKTQSWSVHEWLYFINTLPSTMSESNLAALDKQFNLTKTTNPEIAFAWFLVAIKNNYTTIDESLENHLMSIGRRKLIVPLYQALIDANKGKAKWAHSIYQKARKGYHPLAQNSIDKIFKESINKHR